MATHSKSKNRWISNEEKHKRPWILDACWTNHIDPSERESIDEIHIPFLICIVDELRAKSIVACIDPGAACIEVYRPKSMGLMMSMGFGHGDKSTFTLYYAYGERYANLKPYIILRYLKHVSYGLKKDYDISVPTVMADIVEFIAARPNGKPTKEELDKINREYLIWQAESERRQND